MARYIDPDHTVIGYKGMGVPVDMDNRHYRQLMEEGVVIKPYRPEKRPVDPPSRSEKLIALLLRKGVITLEEVTDL